MIPRYSRPEMTAIWTVESKFQIWLDIETHACDAQVKFGVTPDSAAKAIRKHGAFEVSGTAETLKIIDKNSVLGPLVKAYDSAQAATTATDDLANIAATLTGHVEEFGLSRLFFSGEELPTSKVKPASGCRPEGAYSRLRRHPGDAQTGGHGRPEPSITAPSSRWNRTRVPGWKFCLISACPCGRDSRLNPSMT